MGREPPKRERGFWSAAAPWILVLARLVPTHRKKTRAHYNASCVVKHPVPQGRAKPARNLRLSKENGRSEKPSEAPLSSPEH